MQRRATTSREAREIVIGGLALVVFAVILGASYFGSFLPGTGELRDKRLVAVFNRVDGLGPGSPVYVSGIRVGVVEAAALQPDFRVLVTLRVNRDTVLPADTSAAIHTNGLFGSKFIALDPGGEERRLGDGDRIRFTQDALVVSELLDLIIAQGREARGRAEAGQ